MATKTEKKDKIYDIRNLFKDFDFEDILERICADFKVPIFDVKDFKEVVE